MRLLPLQDTTKRAPAPQSFYPRTFELKTHFRPFAQPSIALPLGRFGGLYLQGTPFEQLDLESRDSLSRLHPELRACFLRELVIQGALRDELLRFSLDKNIWGDRFDYEQPSELEGTLRCNQQLFGTTNNPLRPPPPPNQVDLKELGRAFSNIMRAFGVK